MAHASPGPLKGWRKMKADDSVMATNNSSIVSKRSVERLYYPEPHFFRHFVKKPVRRSPLINRGYWLRMKAIDVAVQRFLEQSGPHRKIVINLGCGYDTLPFQWLSKLPSQPNVTFVDVDFPPLIKRKWDIVRSTPSLCKVLQLDTSVEGTASEPFRSDNYRLLGCDLADTTSIESLLQELCSKDASSLILCIAEVSVTYMDVRAADNLIQWASTHTNCQMCILEQFLPDGPQHPFAEKMIKHFNNLKTPLQSLSTYPSLSDQVRRFEKLGWSSVHATSLWDLWTNTTCIYESERAHLDSVEPFDEWEEFILFASHYFILYAQHDKGPADILPEATDPRVSKAAEHDERPHLRLQYLEPVEPRRFGSCFRTLSGFAYFGGIGERTRTNTTNTFSLKPLCTTPTAYQNAKFDAEAIVPALTSARSCQASATSWNGNTLITGGRESPEKPLCESIYYNGKWHRKSDMPQARFRHCMSWVYHDASSNEEVGVLVFGGKTNDNVILSSWSLWRESSGWHEVSSRGSTVQPLFGASMVNLQHNQGLSLGGLDRNGLIQSTTFYWTFESQNGHLVVHISELNYTNPSQKLMVARVGSRAIPTKYGPLVIGGTSNKVLDANHEIVRLRPPKQFEDGWSTEAIGLQQFYNDATSRQLLVGHSVLHVQGNILIMGGGAVCFSFGTFWSQRPLLLSMTDEACDDAQHSLIKVGPQSIDDENAASRGTTAQHAQHGFGFKQRFTKSMGTSLERPKTLLLLQRVRLQNPEDFQRIALRKTPVIIEGLELGSCVAEWTLDGLVRKIGQDREVTTHTSKDRNMNFVEKNFSYTRKAFGSFVEEITNGSRQYLRSLATDHPSQKPANIANDFPGLAGDFRLPLPLDEVGQRTHSSVLRISGPVEMWLHYDVMANLLCQIVGQKRAVLYPPSDIPYLEVPAGASSSPLAVFDPETLSIHPALRLAHPHEAMLRPGDVLYIPPLWFHAMSPIDDVSVAVNVFFRDLATGYAPGRDIYGNRDLQAYETGRSTVAKMCKSFATLPDQMAGFYLARLSDELKEESVRRFSLSSKLETLTPSSESNGQA